MKRSSEKVTIRDVAAKVGVSASTVSLVLQGKGNLKDVTRSAVMRAIEETGYKKRPVASKQLSGEGFALIVDDIMNPYFHSLYKGLDMVLAESGNFACLLSSNDSVDRQTQLLSDLRSGKVAGIVLVPATGTTEDNLSPFRSGSRPLVMAVRRIARTRFDYIGANPTIGMMMATDRLIALGHKRIGFVGGYQANFAYGERYAGFATSLMNGGVELDTQLIVNGGSTREFGRDGAQRLLELSDPPGAIVAYNDIVALGVMDAIYGAGLEPGRSVAVIGYDDIPEAALQPVPLTSVSTPAEKLGEVIAEAIQGRAVDRSQHEPLDITYPPRLIIRKSCGNTVQTSGSCRTGENYGTTAEPR